jgi:hypothetical protein
MLRVNDLAANPNWQAPHNKTSLSSRCVWARDLVMFL